MAIISISGPVRTGKSTIVSLLSDSLPKDTIYAGDLFTSVWNELIDEGIFTDFTEMFKDFDFLFIYIARVCKRYEDLINQYKNSDKLVVLEGCHIDYLIYSQLNSWFRYPLYGYQEGVITGLLNLSDKVDRVYMTVADDSKYPLGDTKFVGKITTAAFKRNRRLEIKLYDIYRNWNNVVTLPQDMFSSDSAILEDLINNNLI